jgi:hypothetical protein
MLSELPINRYLDKVASGNRWGHILIFHYSHFPVS